VPPGNLTQRKNYGLSPETTLCPYWQHWFHANVT